MFLTPPMVPVSEPLFSRLLEVREVLMFSFDLELFEPPLDADAYADPSPWLPAFTVPGARAAVVGRDAMGGLYVACEFSSQKPCCFHLDTSGHVVLLGETLLDAVALLLAVPYWRELLDQCPTDTLDAMRAYASRLERDVFEDLPNLPEARDYLLGFLALPAPADPVARLYELAQRADSAVVLSPHGWRYESPGARQRSAHR